MQGMEDVMPRTTQDYETENRERRGRGFIATRLGGGSGSKNVPMGKADSGGFSPGTAHQVEKQELVKGE